MIKAKKDSWKNEQMPMEIEEFMLNKVVSPQEFEILEYGRIPEVMEDKWFIYYDMSKLYFHRSWTGYCVYIAEVNKADGGYNIGRVIVNRNKEQYKETNKEADKNLISILISGLLEKSNKENFEKYKQLHT